MKQLLILTLLFSFAATELYAQNTGTVVVRGRVAKAAALRWWTYTPINAEAGINAPNLANGPLAFDINLDDVAAGNSLVGYGGGEVEMILRSNTAYTLDAQVTSSSGFGLVGDGDLALSDVGFGMSSLANSGAKVFLDPAAGSTIAAGFNADPATAGKDGDDEPIFTRTLSDVSASTQVLSGPRISNRGGIGSPNNGLMVTSSYAVGPQFYTPVDPWSATVTYTLATP